MADGQHKLSRPIPPAGRRACPELSRRTLLGAVCASPLIRHSGLDPESTFCPSEPQQGRWIPDQVRDDESSLVTIWDRTLARFGAAQAAVDAATGDPDQDRYDALVDSADESMCALLALPAPNLAALAAKLDVIVAHQAWELTGAEDCLQALRLDFRPLGNSTASPAPVDART